MTAMQSLSSSGCDELIGLFNNTFSHSHNTRLIKGGDEPIYLPADDQCDYHRIIFTRDYYASGLHEIAHWCVAGDSRRQQVDYGYWYAPDGRTLEQQAAFELVEVQPQAMEWIFNVACKRRFRVSADNLSMGLGASQSFKENIYEQVGRYCENGLNDRAEAFIEVLAKYYGVDDPYSLDQYLLETL